MEYVTPFTLEQIKKLKKEYPTPFYVYDKAAIEEQVKNLYLAFSWNEGFKEYFAVKACPNPAILRLLRELGCGADCASVPEVMMSKKCGIDGENIMFTSNETLPEEYARAFAAGAIINLDDITQIENMENSVGIPHTVCCRFNPGEFAVSSDIMGRLYDSKFGMTETQLISAYEILKTKGVQRFGLHSMPASCSLDENYYPSLAEMLFSLALKIKEKTGVIIDFIDMAGGIGIPYRPEEEAVDIFRIGEGVRQAYEKIFGKSELKPAIYTELGRYITGPFGYLITSVAGLKSTYREYVGVDATAACLMRPAIYGAYHGITVLGKENEEKTMTYDVVGSLCENNDKFAVERKLPPVKKGDILVIHSAGAHGLSMGYNYNGKLRCAEFMFDGENFKMIRRKETPEDYFATLDIDEDFK